MNSKIEQAIEELEDFIESCKPRLLNSEEIIVNKEEIMEYLRELKMKTPDEIKRYQKIISNKEAILSDARTKAEALVADATKQTNMLISEHEIMQQAYARADEVVKMAQEQAQSIVDNAVIEANSARSAAAQYMDDVMGYLESIVTNATQTASANYEKLLGSLNQYAKIIKDDRKQLHPEEYDVVTLEVIEETNDVND